MSNLPPKLTALFSSTDISRTHSTPQTGTSFIASEPSRASRLGHGTPIKANTHLQQPARAVSAMTAAMAAELAGSIANTPIQTTKIYTQYNKHKIQEFLDQCTQYDKDAKAWTEVKTAIKTSDKEEVLYTPLCSIIQAILDGFDEKPEERTVNDTHNKSMEHVEDGVEYRRQQENGPGVKVVVKTSPDLCIFGKGFDLCSHDDHSEVPEYAHCLAPLEVKRDKSLRKQDVAHQVAIYARQCFIQQPHRRYVPAAVLTETRVLLHIYDRSGLLHPDVHIDYHDDPITFVRIILGISSITGDLRSSAFDPRIKWDKAQEWPLIHVLRPPENDSRVLRSRSRVELRDSYRAIGKPFVRRAMRGRGTVCWEGKKVDDTKEQESWVRVLIKDSWRSAGRQNEWELLKEIKGVAGVGQMLAYEDDTEHPISEFRNIIIEDLYAEEHPYEFDRIFCRIVLEAYGRSIKYFGNKLQLLHAFYDAVSGHRNVWVGKKILHRDISIENILLGKPDAEVGNRGILIDFDMAIKVDRVGNLSGSQFRTGTRAFQSVAVLKSAEWATYLSDAPPQDHLDDLESFLYVLGYICIKYRGPKDSVMVPYLDDWENSNDIICASIKTDFLTNPAGRAQPYFKSDPVFRTMLLDLGRLCQERLARKNSFAAYDEKFPDLRTVYNSDNASSGKDHESFLAIIKTAIDQLEQRPPEEVPSKDANETLATNMGPPQTPPQTRGASSSTSNIAGGSRGGDNKRKTVESLEDEQSESKRTRGSRDASGPSRTRKITKSKSKSRRP